MRDVIPDSHSEVIFRSRLLQLVEDTLGHGGRKFLRRKAVPPTNDSRQGLRKREGLVEGCKDVQIEGFTDAAGLLGTVQHGDTRYALRNRREEGVHGERSKQA